MFDDAAKKYAAAQLLSEWKRIGLVTDAGGGKVEVVVDRDLDNYPTPGTDVYVRGT